MSYWNEVFNQTSTTVTVPVNIIRISIVSISITKNHHHSVNLYLILYCLYTIMYLNILQGLNNNARTYFNHTACWVHLFTLIHISTKYWNCFGWQLGVERSLVAITSRPTSSLFVGDAGTHPQTFEICMKDIKETVNNIWKKESKNYTEWLRSKRTFSWTYSTYYMSKSIYLFYIVTKKWVTDGSYPI